MASVSLIICNKIWQKGNCPHYGRNPSSSLSSRKETYSYVRTTYQPHQSPQQGHAKEFG
ncbi:hypothetical protein DPMN_062767 [Dreissena polymorpha]|uniref:Uncharacterized protein n=1 Tax=Dreissena polymorpha TaxID=45954 RepID=A0A9D4HJM2_DREPO|nr:hypothetical protein DPMN_062767 [Dreissena polymorpha]